MDLIEKKHVAHLAHLHNPQWTTKKDALRSMHNTALLKLHKMQDSWLSAKADDIRGYIDKNEMKNFYSSLKDVYGTTSVTSSPLLSADGTKLISENKILERWAEHFDGVLNRLSSINDKVIEQLLQVLVNESLNVIPTLGKVQIGICQLSCGKAPGSDSIPAEINNQGGSALTGKLLTLIQLWMKEQLAQDFKEASIIHIYKRKGNWQACDHHHRIASPTILNRDSYWRVNAASLRNMGLLT